MKFKHISNEDVKVLRAAKKILKKLLRKEDRLNDLVDNAYENDSPNLKALDKKHNRMLDELEALGIAACGDGLYLSEQFPSPKLVDTMLL